MPDSLEKSQERSLEPLQARNIYPWDEESAPPPSLSAPENSPSEKTASPHPLNPQEFSSKTLFLADLLDHFDVQLTLALSPLWIRLFALTTGDPLTHATTFHGGYLLTSMLAYPLGSLVFGLIAQRWSPQRALRWSILGFSLSTLGMGLLPEVNTWPLMALGMMVILRFFQSFFARGERALLPIYLVASGNKNKDVDRASLLEFSTFLGSYAAASVGSWILRHQGQGQGMGALSMGGGFKMDSWRMPFVAAGLLGCVLTWWRWKSIKLKETKEKKTPNPTPSTTILPTNPPNPSHGLEFRHKGTQKNSDPQENSTQAFPFPAPGIPALDSLATRRFLALMVISGPWYLFYALAFKLNLFYSEITKIPYTVLLDQSAYFFGIDLGCVLLIRWFLKSQGRQKSCASKALQRVCLLGMTTLIPGFAFLEFFPSRGYIFGLCLALIAVGVFYAMHFFLFIRHLLHQSPRPYLSMATAKMVGTLALGHSCAYLSLKIYDLTHWTCSPGIYGALVCALALWGLRWLQSQGGNPKNLL